MVTIEGAGYSVVGVAANGDEALAAVRDHHPDLVLVDIGLMDQSGIALGRAILDARPETRVVALTVLDDARTAQAAIRAGFDGYLLKDIPTVSFLRTLRRIERGKPVGAPRTMRARSGDLRNGGEQDRFLARQLTPRELQVLELIVAGMPNDRIARQLGISPHTVRSHINSILSKLQLRSRLEAAAFAVRAGLVKALR